MSCPSDPGNHQTSVGARYGGSGKDFVVRYLILPHWVAYAETSYESGSIVWRAFCTYSRFPRGTEEREAFSTVALQLGDQCDPSALQNSGAKSPDRRTGLCDFIVDFAISCSCSWKCCLDKWTCPPLAVSVCVGQLMESSAKDLPGGGWWKDFSLFRACGETDVSADRRKLICSFCVPF